MDDLSCISNDNIIQNNNPTSLNSSDSDMVERKELHYTYLSNNETLESRGLTLVDKGLDALSGICHDCSKNNKLCTRTTTTNSNLMEEENNIPSINDTIEGKEILSAFTSTDDYTIPANVITESNELPIRFLLDIGALQDNYVSLDMAKALEAKGITRSKCNQKVCSAMSGMCKQAQGRMKFYVSYYNVYERRVEKMIISAKVLDIQFDLIIGLPCIKSYNLITEKFAYLFSSGNLPIAANLANPVTTAGRTHTTHPNAVLAGLIRSENIKYVNSPTRVDKLKLLHTTESDSDGIEDYFTTEPWDETPLPRDSDVIDKVYIEGDDPTKSRIREFLTQFRDLFSKQLRPEPANIPPMQLNVDVESWENNPANHRPPRIQSTLRQEETSRQVNDMLAHKVIRPAETEIASYSQVLLTPKPNNQYRFCIDFRNLNLVTKAPVWPIPLIQATIERMGSKRPKYFAVMDLTKGYYQAPLAESSRHFTAFITLMGLYEWTRVPMGLKGAPAYFQRVMATIVFAGLIYKILEIYLDDVIVYAQSIDELINNLKVVFTRLRKHNITLNPEKCRFGMTETEYVGRVLNFREPQKLGELKSFIGLCEYFHSHIRHFAEITKPLHEALHGYEKKYRNTRLRFTEEQRKAYLKIQEEITNSATLYFIDEHAPITLQTDASDYGIGAYLFQRIDGKEKPVAILSKSLDRTQLRWSTPEKEGYAIYYALKKFEYLLRDVHFTLQTDHKNLIYINDTASPKVVRWKLAIQEYNFDIEHIAGVTNTVADSFSRFCNFPTKEKKITEDMSDNVLGLLDEFEIPRDKFKIIAACHNTFVGHHGIHRTCKKIENYLTTGTQIYSDDKQIIRNKTYEKSTKAWPEMKEHVKVFIRRCPCCQKMNKLKVPIHTQPFTTASYFPFDKVAVDTIGPLPPDANGNKFIIVFIDCFSRYVSLYPVPDTTGLNYAKALIKYLGHHPCPSQLVTDNGTQFKNELTEALNTLLGINHKFTFPYSKEENGLVERVNKEVMRHMRNIIFDMRVKKQWSDYYPLVERIINTQVHSVTQVSPAQIIYGNSIDLDRVILRDKDDPIITRHQEKMNLSDWTAKMLNAQADIIKIAQEHQEEHDVHHISMHTAERTEFPINSYVLVQYENIEHKPPSKLHPQLRGPYQVVNYTGSIYTVRNLVTNKLEDFHVTNIRHFEYDPLVVDPRKVANIDQDMVDINDITKHTGTPNRRANMKFLVHWSDGEETWEPWSNVRRTEAFHKYFEQNNMKHLIPREFFDGLLEP